MSGEHIPEDEVAPMPRGKDLMVGPAADDKWSRFREDVRASINRNSMEGMCDVPDFILADYVVRCLKNLVAATCENGEWHSER